MSRKRATRSGQSKPRPLYVTSQAVGRQELGEGLEHAGLAGLVGQEELDLAEGIARPPAQADRKATVPAPVARPVVSVSRQTSGTSGPGWSGSAGDPVAVDRQA